MLKMGSSLEWSQHFCSIVRTQWADCPIACLGNMNLSNCAEFDNLTLNCSMGTKLSTAGYFPFAQFDTIYINKFHQAEKIGPIDLAERFVNNNWTWPVFLILLFLICKLLYFISKMIRHIAIVQYVTKLQWLYKFNTQNWKTRNVLFE